MREMTTAEFAKANLAALDEPISVRRYTKVVGTYFPAGLEPSEAPAEPTLGLERPGTLDGADKVIVDLELEVKRLKQELAKRPVTPDAWPAPARSSRASDDPFAGLAKQDAEFFERKLGLKPRKR